MNKETKIAKLKKLIAEIEARGITTDTEFDQLLKDMDLETLELEQNICIELHGPDGEIKDTRYVHNLITTAGKNLLLAASSAKYLNQFTRIAIGTGTTSPDAGDTALQTEVARSAGVTPTNPSSNILQFQTTFAAGTGTGAIAETGLFDANSSGNMLNRSTFSVVNKGASDELTMTIQIS